MSTRALIKDVVIAGLINLSSFIICCNVNTFYKFILSFLFQFILYIVKKFIIMIIVIRHN